MRMLHVSIHSRPRGVRRGGEFWLEGRPLRTLAVQPAEAAAPLDVTFEQAQDALLVLPRMIMEPDGSFVWVAANSPQEDAADNPHDWQLEGVLYDQGERLSYVELNGTCNARALDQLLTAFAPRRTPLMFQLLAQAVFLDEDVFRHWLFDA